MKKVKEYTGKSSLALEQIETIVREKGFDEENSAQLFDRLKLVNLYLTRITQSLNDH